MANDRIKTASELKASYTTKILRKFEDKFGVSKDIFDRNSRYFPNSVSQIGRYYAPFPVHFEGAKGPNIYSADGYKLIDFWAAHFCMTLGHNPDYLNEAIQGRIASQCTFQLGLPTDMEGQVASAILSLTNDDKILFSQSGASATMHAIMLASAATGREKIVKIEGGWHGVNPWVMSGVRMPSIESSGFSKPECGGIPQWFENNVITIPFNDVKASEVAFEKHGSCVAACIMELVLGNSGMVMATPEFAHAIRKLCTKSGSVLILDELVTGFRVKLGGLQDLYGIKGDLNTYGKAISGGMPFACITGKQEIMNAAKSNCDNRVFADSGTFTSHPGTLAAVLTTINELISGGSAHFSTIIEMASAQQEALKQIFDTRGISVDITGVSTLSELSAFPISTIRFVSDHDLFNTRENPLVHWDPQATDIVFRNEISRIALMLEGVFSWQGLGVTTSSHTKSDLDFSLEAYSTFADEIRGIFP